MEAKLQRLMPDLNQAQLHLKLLSRESDRFLFVAIDDDQDRKRSPKTLFGSLEQYQAQLIQLNQQGYAIHVTVNEMVSGNRKEDQLQSIRAVWIENDSGERIDTPVKPNFVVESSPGKYHDYFLTEGMTLFQQIALQQYLVESYQSDPNAADVSRVLRLAGFYHQKKSQRKGLTGTPHMVSIVEENSAGPYEPDGLMSAFGLSHQLSELLQANSKAAAKFATVANGLESLRHSLFDPDTFYLDESKDEQVRTHIRLLCMGEEGSMAPLSKQLFKPIERFLSDLSASSYSPRLQGEALSALDKLKQISDSILPMSSHRQAGKNNTGEHEVLRYIWPQHTIDETRTALSLIDSEDRDIWIKVGMALKSQFGEAGLAMWDEWSSDAPNYDGGSIQHDWNSLTPNNISAASIFHLAQQSIRERVNQAFKVGAL